MLKALTSQVALSRIGVSGPAFAGHDVLFQKPSPLKFRDARKTARYGKVADGLRSTFNSFLVASFELR